MSAPSDPNGWRKYRPIAEIGRGGMADVCLAVAQGPAGFNKLVVLKRVRAELVEDAEILAMFLDEARLAARLNHPNVVQTHEVGDEGARFFIAMEYLDGQPLGSVRSRMGHDKVPLPLQVRVLCDALAGLHYAHNLRDFDGTPIQVVHRDVSPQNIFVTYDGVIKVVDFGIAKAADSLTETRTGMLKGKVSYMSPEQARGERVDRRSDVFSVGVILWEAIARRRMWKGFNDLAILGRLAIGEVPSLREEASKVDVDPEIERICQKALAPALEGRYATAAELQADLERWLVERHRGMTAREAGEIVASQFADDRARIKQVVEEQLRGVRWTGSYPRVTLTPDLPKLGTGRMSTTPTMTAPAAISHSSDATSMVPSVSATEAKERAARPNRAMFLVAVTFVAIGGTVSVGVLRAQPWRLAAGDHRQAQVAAPPAMEPSPTQEEDIRLVVRVSPVDAKVSIDGSPTSSGAYEGRLARDGRVHVIRVEAPGFIAQEETITASNDLFLSLALKSAPEAQPGRLAPIGRGAPAGAAAAPPASAAPPSSAPAPLSPPSAEQKPKRGIDLESPYAR
ncbi:serine/threonine protein kinase [Sorangium atrum]|uniref:Serine/threonine-protein kinase n=1 Tax=Sorangium atrum TaxID=2995308 RepID=A0ABT5C1Z5_9BACT|nr:serine/threonine-protein kinase [Sorangium aterium]MDC0680426.1 serine/threonine-protein kinase [Sorangium aterium]